MGQMEQTAHPKKRAVTSIRFNPTELAVLDQIKAVTGLKSRSDVIRQAINTLDRIRSVSGEGVCKHQKFINPGAPK